MEYEKIQLGKFIIAGISVRTINRDNRSQRDISELWGRLLMNNVVQSIPNKVSDDIYCMYTDYESDFTGEYTTILGCQVSSIEGISDEYTIKEVPTSNYYKFISEGRIPETIAKTWDFIWQSNIKRKYEADFEVYGKSAENPENAIVATYLSIE